MKKLHDGGSGTGRRSFLQVAAAALGPCLMSRADATNSASAGRKSVAAVVTIYIKDSHTDLLIGKILEGWEQAGGAGPELELSSIYVDQFPDRDISRQMSDKHGFPVCDSIEQAMTLGEDRVAVDGVISVGEHGDYPWNERGQHLYPRRRFFEQITNTLEKYQRIVPVFSDKHPGPVWKDARWMYDRARQLRIPFMAGSSLPVTYRKPDFDVPMNCDLEACIAIGYSGLDIYGSHTLDFLQCIIERRQCDHQGVDWVQCLPGSRLQALIDDNVIRSDLLKVILDRTPTAEVDLLSVDPQRFAIFLIRYADGLLAPVLMLPGYSQAISAVVKIRGEPPVGGIGEERTEPRYPHFANLLKGIEQMMHTGTPAYPVERSVLTAGILDRLLRSRSLKGRKLRTPELAINYRAVDYPHAPHLDLSSSFAGS